MHNLTDLIQHKGLVIGLWAAVLKVVLAIRTSVFQWFIAISDLIITPLMGLSFYDFAAPSPYLEEWQVVLLTFFISINTFVVVAVITNPRFIKSVLSSFLRIDENKQ